jgi:hypothetical protein
MRLTDYNHTREITEQEKEDYRMHLEDISLERFQNEKEIASLKLSNKDLTKRINDTLDILESGQITETVKCEITIEGKYAVYRHKGVELYRREAFQNELQTTVEDQI